MPSAPWPWTRNNPRPSACWGWPPSKAAATPPPSITGGACSGYQMLANVIAAAQQRAGAGAVPAADTAGDRPGIEVTLNLPPGAQVAPAATVYVFARDPNAASRMPIAVRRLTAGDLPATVVLSDADSMAGQRLSEVAGVVISAQLSRNGQPGEANAAYLGRSGTVNPGVGSSAVSIQLAPVDAIP